MRYYNPALDILNAIGGKNTGKKIMVAFLDGRMAIYSARMAALMRDDPAVGAITDAETGELYFYR